MTQSTNPQPDRERFPLAASLSERQSECLRLAAQGLASREIGRRLSLSARTVDDHILLACRTLGVRTRVQAVARLVGDDRRAGERRTFAP
ncbi:helix-turn-helix domain-containing protein [Brevundimonas variabilis]|uniref:helix-turn-helix domain-containing protein n=1 Tax=Brevundimonas variabilis TaxID=74312 RepID=UPI001605E81B|nr:helix-turn-helix transcriptional regulator [Brevundimonas variabilis]